MTDDLTPVNREEILLAAMSDPDIALPDPPYTRKERLLVNAIEAIRSGGGGGGEGGTTNYAQLTNKPRVNGVTLSGDMSSADLGIVVPTKTSDLTDDVGYARAADMTTALAGKVDAVAGKGLSSNDFTTAEKTKLDGLPADATNNVGTITGVKMNGVTKGVSGVVDLGTVLTEHQDISGKADKADVDAALAEKIDKVTGMGLSANSYTTADKTKLEGVEDGAQVNEVSAEEQRSNVIALNALKWENGVLRTQIDSILNGLDIPIYHDAAGIGAIKIQDAAAGAIKSIQTSLSAGTTLYIQVSNSTGMTSATAQTSADGTVRSTLTLAKGLNMVYVTTGAYTFTPQDGGTFAAHTDGTFVNDHVNENGVRSWDGWSPKNGVEAVIRYARDGELGAKMDSVVSYDEFLGMLDMGVEYVRAQDIETAIQAQSAGKEVFIKIDGAPFATQDAPIYAKADPTQKQYKIYYIANYHLLS